MSSRNVHLGPEERAAALALHRALEQGRKAVEDQGARSAADIEAAMLGTLEAAPLVRVDYAVAVGAEDLERRDSLSGDTLLLVAGWVGATRLIDSFVVRARPVRAAEGETR